MKVKKLISMFLVLSMVVSCLTALPFTAQASDVVAPLTNLIPQGDMEDSTATFTVKGTPSYATDKALTDNENNKVLKIDGSSASSNATNLTLKSLTPMTAGRTYYIDFDYKIILGSSVRVRNAAYGPAIVANNGDANTWYKFSKTIAEDYTNIITPDADTYYQDIVVGTGTKGTELYIDNLVFYDITDAVEIAANTDAAVEIVNAEGMQTVNGKLMANKGSIASFKVETEYGYSVSAVSVNGTVLTPDSEGVYSFTVAESANAITVTTARELVNLIPQGDMEDGTAAFTVKGTPSYVTDKALTDNENNKVLKIDGSSASTSATNLTLKSLTPMTAGRTYYIDFDYKIILDSNVRVRNAAYGNAVVTNKSYANSWYRLSEMYNSEKYNNVLTPTEDTYYQDIIVGTGEKGTELYIDNLVFYDVTDAYRIELPEGVTITDGGVSMGSVGFAFPGRTVSFTVDGTPDSVMINGNVVTGTDNTYSFTMPQSEVTVLVVSGQSEESTVKYAVTAKKPYAIFDSAATVTLIVAEYKASGALKDAYISTVTGTAGQKIDLTEIEAFKDIENWSAKTIYTWSDLISLNPIRSACIMEEL